MTDIAPVPTPRTQEAIKRHAAKLSQGTGWRWMNGYFPSIIHWIVTHEDVAAALYADARALADAHKPADVAAN